MKSITAPVVEEHTTSSFCTMKYPPTAFVVDHLNAVRWEEIITLLRRIEVLIGEFVDCWVNRTRLRKP
jgi:hypothetical protein